MRRPDLLLRFRQMSRRSLRGRRWARRRILDGEEVDPTSCHLSTTLVFETGRLCVLAHILRKPDALRCKAV